MGIFKEVQQKERIYITTEDETSLFWFYLFISYETQETCKKYFHKFHNS